MRFAAEGSVITSEGPRVDDEGYGHTFGGLAFVSPTQSSQTKFPCN